MHGLRLMIKEEALIISDQLIFPAVTELAKRGLLSPETWHCNRASALRPRLTSQGTVIEQNGDGLLEESHMPVGWPFFSVQRLHGSRQVVQHVLLHVARWD